MLKTMNLLKFIIGIIKVMLTFLQHICHHMMENVKKYIYIIL